MQILREGLENGYAFHMYSVVSVYRCTSFNLDVLSSISDEATFILKKCAQPTIIDVIEDHTES